MKNKNKNKNQGGFTLIELLVVLAIIGVLAVLILQNLTTARAKARDTQRKTEVNQLGTALETWADDNGAVFPDVDGNVGSTDIVPITGSTLESIVITAPGGKYIKKMPVDPRGNQNYLYGSDGFDYEIWAKLEASNNSADWYVATSGVSSIVTPLPAHNGTPVWGDSGL